MSVRKYSWILLCLCMSIAVLSCVSKETPSEEPMPKQVKDEPPKKIVPERVFEHSPYLKNSETNVYIKNRGIIEQFGKQLGITSPFIIGIVKDVHLSIDEDNFSMVINVENTPLFQKKLVMKNIDARALDDSEKHWKQEQESGSLNYFDISYRNMIIVSNIDIYTNTEVWGWEVPAIISDYSKRHTAHSWMWSKANMMIETYKMDNFSINWGAMIITDYPNEITKNITVSVMFDYIGDKSMRTTIKLLVPFLLESMGGVDVLASLPNIMFAHQKLILEHIRLDRKAFWKYFTSN